MLFGIKLRELRLAKGMSQKDLAVAAGTRQQNITKWENGETKPLFDAVISLAKALGVRTAVFEDCEFGEVEDKRGRGRPTNEEAVLAYERARTKKKTPKKKRS